MAGKTLYVVLTANASAYKAALNDAGAETREFGRDVDAAGKRLDGLDGSLANSAVGSRKLSDEVNQLSGRLRLVTDAIVAFGPALIPIGALAVPAVAGLTTQVAAAGLAAVTTMVAFRGVTDAAKAVNAYKIDPSSANLEKAQQALESLPQSARAFVLGLEQIKPTLSGIQEAAADGIFPGLDRSLDDVEKLGPKLERLLGSVGNVTGDLAAEATNALAGPEWDEFWTFLEAEAPTTLQTLGRTLGQASAGVAGLIMAADPMSDDFGQWLLDAATGFHAWADGVDETQGFQEFMAYLDETGPQVAATTGALADGLLQVLEAAAPMGGPVLAGIEAFADLIGGIADSPVGPTILGMAAAFVVLNRALSITAGLANRAGLTALGTKLTNARPGVTPVVAGATVAGARTTAATRAPAATTRTPIPVGLTPPVVTPVVAPSGRVINGFRDLGNAIAYSAHSRETLARAEQSGSRVAAEGARNALRARDAVQGQARAFAGAAAPIAGLTLLTTGMADGFGITNTASLALMGTMAGPWGAAVGGAVGAVMDIRAANDEWEASLQRVNAALQTNTAQGLQDALAGGAANTAAAAKLTADERGDNGVGSALSAGVRNTFTGGLDVLWGGDSVGESMEQEADRTRQASNDILNSLGELQVSMGGANPFTGGDNPFEMLGVKGTPTLEKLRGTIEAISPAMAELGLTWEDMDSAASRNAVSDWISDNDSAAGRIDNLATAVQGLGNGLLTTEGSAGALATSLDALLSPNLAASQAADDWAGSLRHLGDDLAETNRSLVGHGDAVEQNRTAIRGRVAELKGMLTAEAAAGAGPVKLTRSMEKQRSALIRSATAAGLNKREVSALINEMGLTPKAIRTTFQSLGITKVEQDARNLRDIYRRLPRNVRTAIKADGIPKTRADANKLADTLNLTAKDRRTLIRLVDRASGQGKAVAKLLDMIGGKSPRPRVTLDDNATPVGKVIKNFLDLLGRQKPRPTVTANDNASGVIRGVLGLLAGIRDRTATITTVHRDVRVAAPQGVSANPTHQAEGGIWQGGVRKFAEGGYGVDGTYYARESQIVPGGANIMWAERETGREAYISDKPSARNRNVSILGEVAGWYGMDLTPRQAARAQRDALTGFQAAVGGFSGRNLPGPENRRYGSQAATGGGLGQTIIVRQQLPGTMKLSIEGREFTAYVRGQAAEVTADSLDRLDGAEDRAERMMWG